MSTYKFIKKTVGVQVQKDGTVIHNWERMPDDIRPASDGTKFDVIMDNQPFSYYMAGNTIIINSTGSDSDVTASGASVICDNLRDNVFVNNK